MKPDVSSSSEAQLLMGETKLFEILNQLNQLVRKMIHCFEGLEIQADDACWSKQSKNQPKHE